MTQVNRKAIKSFSELCSSNHLQLCLPHIQEILQLLPTKLCNCLHSRQPFIYQEFILDPKPNRYPWHLILLLLSQLLLQSYPHLRTSYPQYQSKYLLQAITHGHLISNQYTMSHGLITAHNHSQARLKVALSTQLWYSQDTI